MLSKSLNSSGSQNSWIQYNSGYGDKIFYSGRGHGLLHFAFPTTPAEVSSVKDLFDFKCSGPLVDNLGRLQPFPFDDFYLTAEGQAKLRESNLGNALLEFHGNAGSHDLSLSVETLTALRKLIKGMKMKIPRYDKSADNGRGDRADPSKWPEVERPLKKTTWPWALERSSCCKVYNVMGFFFLAVLFEGWMLGFKPFPSKTVKAVDPQLETVNMNLEAYYDVWDKFVNAWIVIKIQDPNCIYQWRLQAEIAMRANGKPGMSDEEVMDFVSRYLPAYKAYLPTLYSEGPNGSDPEHVVVIEIDDGRNPILGSQVNTSSSEGYGEDGL